MDEFDLAPEPLVEGLNIAGTPPLVPQRKPQQPQQGNRGLMMRVAALLPIALAKGGPQAAAGLLAGIQQGIQRKQQEQMQQATLDRQGAMDDRAARAEQRAIDQQQFTQQQARARFMTDFAGQLGSVDDPDAVTGMLDAYGMAGSQLGVERGALEKVAMQVAKPSKIQQNAAKTRIATLQKQYGDKWIEIAKNSAHKLPYVEGNLTLDQVAAIANGGTAQEATPLQVPQTAARPRAYQRTEAIVNGQRTFVNYNPDDGKLYDMSGNEVQATPIPPQSSGGGGQRPMTPGQRANVIGSRRSQWQRFSKAVTDRQQAVAKVDAGLAALDRGNRNAATQQIILAFNKLQDETSVVREGEYARSEQLAPILSRIEGAFVRITAGGGALNDAELRKLALEAKETARMLEAVSNEAAANLRQGIEEELADYGIPTSRVFGNSQVGKVRPTAPTDNGKGTQPTPSGTGSRIKSVTPLN